jgi:RNA polymerase sigma-70 factor (ECF subfamily)
MSTPPSSLHTELLHALLARLQQGDRTAADELIRRASLRLEALARRMLHLFPTVRGQVYTDEVMQGAQLRLLNALGAVPFENTTHFFAVVTRHIRFHLLDLVEQHRRSPQPLDDLPEKAAAGPGPAEAVEELERLRDLHTAVEGLPEQQQQVVDLRIYHDCSWPEIALLLGVNEKTARRQWHRALMALRDSLGGWAPSDGAEPEPPAVQPH